MTDKRRAEAPERGKSQTEAPAKIALLYESKDGRLCLFQDGAGHLTAVRTANLA